MLTNICIRVTQGDEVNKKNTPCVAGNTLVMFTFCYTYI